MKKEISMFIITLKIEPIFSILTQVKIGTVYALSLSYYLIGYFRSIIFLVETTSSERIR
jgi:hypothetical protein